MRRPERVVKPDKSRRAADGACAVPGGDDRSLPDACPRAHYGFGPPLEGCSLALARSAVSRRHYAARSAAPAAPALAVTGYIPARGGRVRPPVAFVAAPGVGQPARAWVRAAWGDVSRSAAPRHRHG